jgi:hypothetical protein
MHIFHVVFFNMHTKILCQLQRKYVEKLKKDEKGFLDTNERPAQSHDCAKLPQMSLPNPTCQGRLGVPRILPYYVYTLGIWSFLLSRRRPSLWFIMGSKMCQLFYWRCMVYILYSVYTHSIFKADRSSEISACCQEKMIQSLDWPLLLLEGNGVSRRI